MDASSTLSRLRRQPAHGGGVARISELEASTTRHDLAVHTGMVISAVSQVGGDLHIVLHRPNAPVAFALVGATPTTMWSCEALVGGTIVAADRFASGSLRLKVRTRGTSGVIVVVTATSTRWLPA